MNSEQCERNLANNHRNAAIVTKADWTETSYARCSIDMFAADEVMVTSIDDGHVMQIYRPGTWRDATSWGSDGYPEFSFTSNMEAERLQKAK
jgi:hypothetical protein